MLHWLKKQCLWSFGGWCKAGFAAAGVHQGFVSHGLRPGEGKSYPDPSQSTHVQPLRQVSCFALLIIYYRSFLFAADRFCSLDYVATLSRHCFKAWFATALSRNHANIPVFRVTGSSSPTKVVLMLVMSMRRLRSFSFLSTSLNILQMRKSPRPS